MKLEQLEAEWLADSKITSNDLGNEALKIPFLHHKWYKFMIEERILLHKLKEDIAEKEFMLEGFFAKTLTVEELHANNLTYTDKKILRPDIPRHIAIHPIIINLKLKLSLQYEKCEYLKDIIKMIHSRSFLIKDAIEWHKFSNGLN